MIAQACNWEIPAAAYLAHNWGVLGEHPGDQTALECSAVQLVPAIFWLPQLCANCLPLCHRGRLTPAELSAQQEQLRGSQREKGWVDWDGVQREDSVDAGDTCSGLELLKCSDRNQIYARSSKSSSAPFILDYCREFLTIQRSEGSI